MTVSVYSCLAALFWFDLAVIVCGCLRMSKRFSYQFGLWPLGAALAAGGLRIVFPIELPMTVVIHSDTALPAIQDTLRHTWTLGGRFSFSFTGLLLAVWAAGLCIFLARLAVLLLRDFQKFNHLAVIPDKRMEALLAETTGEMAARCRLILTPEAPVPLAAGITTPTFILPLYITGFSDEEIRYILRHEQQHFLHHDAWIKLSIEIVICCFWWNLPVYLLRRDLNQFLEVNCDLSVIKDYSPQEQGAYLEAIMKSVKRHEDRSLHSVVFSRLFEPDNTYNIRQRFYLVQCYNKRRNRLVLGGYGILLALVWLASLLVVVQPESYPPETEIMELETDNYDAGVNDVFGIEEGEMFLKQADDGRYVLYINGEPWFYLSEEELATGPFSQLPIKN